MIYKYGEFNESNINDEFLKLGYDKSQLDSLNKIVSDGELGNFLNSENKHLTFGLLNAIYLDCLKLHRGYELKKGAAKALVRAIPIVASPVSALVSFLGEVFGSSRAVGKILKPILNDPGKSYPDFLKKLVSTSIKIVEGEIAGDDPIKKAFVVSDGLIDMLDKKVLLSFTMYLSDKMTKEDNAKIVPDYYIENELRKYLNDRFLLNPPMVLKSIKRNKRTS